MGSLERWGPHIVFDIEGGGGGSSPERLALVPLGNDVNLDQGWFKHPDLILGRRVVTYQDFTEKEMDDMHDLLENVYEVIGDEFERKDCQVIDWHGGRVENPREHMLVLNPVFLGGLPEEALDAFALADSEELELERVLRENLPEQEKHPLAVEVGYKEMELGSGAPSHFTNVIIYRDDERLGGMSYRQRELFNNVLRAKYGSLKTLQVAYIEDENGLHADHLRLSSLEGGNPLLTGKKTARRMMVFGSGTEVPDAKKFDGPDLITKNAWMKSPTVKGVIAFGKFLGKRGLIGRPIGVGQLVDGKTLRKYNELAVGYSQQQEGALYATGLEFFKVARFLGLSTDALAVITCSGRNYTLKTDLKEIDMGPAINDARGDLIEFGVSGMEIAGLSVEARELNELQENAEVPMMEIEWNDEKGGLVPMKGGQFKVRVIRAAWHIHAGAEVVVADDPEDQEVIVVEMNIEEDPPVGCGIDLMEEQSKKSMIRAGKQFVEGEMKAKVALVPVANHGTNGFEFWTVNDEGIIPELPYEHARDLIDQGVIVYSDEVPQV